MSLLFLNILINMVMYVASTIFVIICVGVSVKIAFIIFCDFVACVFVDCFFA